MQLSRLEENAYEKLRRNNLIVFTIRDLCLLLKINKIKAYNLVKSLKKKNAINKIKNGLFAFKDVDDFVLATAIHYPSYVSFWSALSYYKFTDNMPRKIFVATTRYSREINNFRYITLSKKRFFGYTMIGDIIIAEKEKAIIDSLLFPKYAGGIKEISKCMKSGLKELDIKKLIGYAFKTESRVVLRRLGFILENFGYKGKHLKEIRKGVGKGYELLDPSLNKKNNLNKKWLLDINC